MSISSGSRKRRREATYQRGYEAGLAAAAAKSDPVAYLRHGEQTFVQNVPFGAMWISDEDDPRSFPVYDRPQRSAPSIAVTALAVAYQKYLDAVRLYNERHAIMKTKALGTMRVDEEYKAIDEARRAFDKLAVHVATSAISAQVQDAPEKVGRFGHHHEPAIDFCIEVEALEGHLFDAKHGIGKPGHEPRRIDDEFRRRVSSAMDFIVGGDQIAIAAKATLRSISAQVQDVAGWQLVPKEPTQEMVDAGQKEADECVRVYGSAAPLDVYIAMLAAAPAKQEGGE
jgi:hypothetical protein